MLVKVLVTGKLETSLVEVELAEFKGDWAKLLEFSLEEKSYSVSINSRGIPMLASKLGDRDQMIGELTVSPCKD